MTAEHAQFITILQVPHLERVTGRRDGPLPISCYRHAAHRTCMAAESVQLSTTRQVPHLECVIV